MRKSQEKTLFQETIALLRNKGTRFTVDDLSNAMHISKKTIYASFPSKEELAAWVYQKAFDAFDEALSSAKGEGHFFSPDFTLLLEAYADLLSITEEDTFNRYSLNPALKESTQKAMVLRRSRMYEHLKHGPLAQVANNPAFLLSFDSSLLALVKEGGDDLLIEAYASVLKKLV